MRALEVVGRPTPGRGSHCNGHRHRVLDARVGTVDVAISKLRRGTRFSEGLLERRRRAQAALITVVAGCYLAGVSPRRMGLEPRAVEPTALCEKPSRPSGPVWPDRRVTGA